jgi:hypothetical protein
MTNGGAGAAWATLASGGLLTSASLPPEPQAARQQAQSAAANGRMSLQGIRIL